MTVLLDTSQFQKMKNKGIILHIVNDDKFIDDQIDFLSKNNTPSLTNLFITFTKNNFKYIKTLDKVKKIQEEEFLLLFKNKEIKAVFLHSLYVIPLYLLEKIPQKIKVFWFAWGYDIYKPYPYIKSHSEIKLYHKYTKFAIINSSLKKFSKNILCRFGLYQHERNIYINAIKRIDYFSGVIPTEYNLIKKNPYFRAKQFHWMYSLTSSLINQSKIYSSPIITGKNILLGNSGDPTNNHIDAMTELTKYLDNKSTNKIILPLSYGGDPHYLKKVISFGKKKFSNSFIPLTKFMPFDQYNALISECANCIFYHERQQALGNIILAIWNGAKIYMSKTSILYKYLKSLGFIIFTVQNDLNLFLNKNLEPTKVIHNRKLIIQHFSEDVAKNYVDKFYQIIK